MGSASASFSPTVTSHIAPLYLYLTRKNFSSPGHGSQNPSIPALSSPSIMSRLESNTWNLSAVVTSTHASSSPPDPQPDTMGSPLRGTPRSGKLPNTASSTTSPLTDLSFSVRFSVSRRSISAASAASAFAAATRSLCRSLNFALAVASFFATAGDTRYLSTA